MLNIIVNNWLFKNPGAVLDILSNASKFNSGICPGGEASTKKQIWLCINQGSTKKENYYKWCGIIGLRSYTPDIRPKVYSDKSSKPLWKTSEKVLLVNMHIEKTLEWNSTKCSQWLFLSDGLMRDLIFFLLLFTCFLILCTKWYSNQRLFNC